MFHVGNWLSDLEKASIAIFVKSSEGRYLAINDVGAEMVGREVHVVLGKSDFDIFENSSARLMAHRDSLIRQSGKASMYDSIARCSTGWKYFHSMKIPVQEPNGRSETLIGLSIDISKHRDPHRLKIMRENFMLIRQNPPFFCKILFETFGAPRRPEPLRQKLQADSRTMVYL